MTDGDAMIAHLGSLRGRGITRALAVVRHAAREYVEGRHDLENPLTDEGRSMALSFGERLPADLTVRAYSSPVERCVDTAGLILEGHRAKGGAAERHRVVEGLGLFFILDQRKMFRLMRDVHGGGQGFIRAWCDRRIGEDVVIPAQDAARIMLSMLASKLPPGESALTVGVSHDFNLFMLREQLLGMRLEDHGHVEYLDGIVVFEDADGVWVEAPGVAPIALDDIET
ncbi:MAG: histidine phosphatase family protein [Gammaproteobacteria bacterium]|nr:histidine phosphatase family protein [Gammaproteobacteria bacterium]